MVLPFFAQIKVPALAAGASQLYSIAHSDNGGLLNQYRRFAPFRNMTVVNLSSSSIEIQFDYNADRTLFASNGGAPVSHNQPFTTFLVTNVGGTAITANQVRIWIENL